MVRVPAKGWRDRAECRDMPTSLFFDPQCYRQLRLICWRCPVRVECLDDTLRVETLVYGFRGGLDEHERRIEARRRGIAVGA